MTTLSGKTVMVTGALGSIGRAMVYRYCEEGAKVIALDLPGKDDVAAKWFKPEQGVRFFGCDLEQLESLETSALELADELGGIDVLVNNAVFSLRKAMDEFSIAEYEKHVRINSSATFVLSRACSQLMKRKKYGKIICVSTYLIYGHMEHFAPYVASKGAVNGLIKGLSRELGPHGINVNGIAPGGVQGDVEPMYYGDELPQYEAWLLAHQALKRRIQPVDIANLAIFLSSTQSDMIAGQNIHCDGGW